MAHRVCVVGGGSFGSVVARVAANGVGAHPGTFKQTIPWWVRRPEMAEEINEKRVNSQYLGAAHLPEALQASTDLGEVSKGATVCIIALPGEFLANVLALLDQSLHQDCVIVSLIKSLKVNSDCSRVVPYSEVLAAGLSNRPVAALMGPNIYREMARDEFAEATIGCAHRELWPVLVELFETPLFHVDLLTDLVGVEMCGCLKNTVTITCGIAKGLGWGENVKAAIIRRGMLEIGQFLAEFMGSDKGVLLQACGVGDIVLSCNAGRGQALAAAFVEAGGRKSWSELEDEIMNGMRLPDWHNVQNVFKLLDAVPGATERYPLLAQTYRIAFEGAAPTSVLEPLRAAAPTI
mmetsp:Transcript_66437/g.171800  ORF Transcript_66437/g.171800 Transcript_66437/m.171800 type:complete len:349 (+) Transcript_66437:60-1106(+)|eukprot:CAMPEP_0183472384 /NCGR_PEP_ID=MMETSP0370-20130417/159482_1 /TAXON_ID=268820 /ORGANISM="Peridinium aciculiferum, Strain PAER-2" /LENGTH=348 /DNA_ID=CAMNT_0025665017 /DNA_START=5 /DNA_END=1051 /DNA_ORIENTATION=-